MKIIASYLSNHSADSTGLNVLVWPDSAMIRSGKPVFLPDDAFYCILLGLGAKIKSVGKSIGRMFASRYYDEVMPVVFILNEDATQKILKREDPSGGEIVADYSVICGNTTILGDPRDIMGTRIEVIINPLPGAEPDTESVNETFGFANVKEAINEAIVEASIKNTLKTGDIVAYLLPRAYNADPETVLRVKMDNETLIENKLK